MSMSLPPKSNGAKSLPLAPPSDTGTVKKTGSKAKGANPETFYINTINNNYY